MISFVIPTRDRPEELDATLGVIGRYPLQLLGRGCEVVIVENDARTPIDPPATLANGIGVELVRLDHNAGAAARNTAAERASNPWLVMLDDDSAPIGGDFARTLGEVDSRVACVGGEIFLPSRRREAGGLPGVVVGCGAAMRKHPFLEVGGYDPTFDYYVEEYDLAAKLLARGYATVHTTAISFEHRKVDRGRDFARILARLVRNNGWVIERHAPEPLRERELAEMLARYRVIAAKENATQAFWRALRDLRATSRQQTRTPLTMDDWSRLTGADLAGAAAARLADARVDAVRLVSRGKGAETIERSLCDAGIRIDERAARAVVATLSPGPVLDAIEDHPDAVAVWSPERPGSLAASA